MHKGKLIRNIVLLTIAVIIILMGVFSQVITGYLQYLTLPNDANEVLTRAGTFPKSIADWYPNTYILKLSRLAEDQSELQVILGFSEQDTLSGDFANIVLLNINNDSYHRLHDLLDRVIINDTSQRGDLLRRLLYSEISENSCKENLLDWVYLYEINAKVNYPTSDFSAIDQMLSMDGEARVAPPGIRGYFMAVSGSIYDNFDWYTGLNGTDDLFSYILPHKDDPIVINDLHVLVDDINPGTRLIANFVLFMIRDEPELRLTYVINRLNSTDERERELAAHLLKYYLSSRDDVYMSDGNTSVV